MKTELTIKITRKHAKRMSSDWQKMEETLKDLEKIVQLFQNFYVWRSYVCSIT